MEFVHLHLHSEYSMLDGACRLSLLPKAAKDLGFTALALTDHGNMFGAVTFYKECRKAGVKPIIGCEVYVAPGSRFEKNKDDRYNHLTLLCENETGYRNLCKLVSAGYTEGFYSKPRVDDELLSLYHEGLIALSGCVAGRIPQLILMDDEEGAEREAQRYGALFGTDHFFLEIQNHFTEEEKKIEKGLCRLSERTGLPLVATNDVHYIRRKDADVQAVLLCIQTGRTLEEGRPFGFESDEYYLKSPEEMANLFKEHPKALENTGRIAERCRFDFDFSERHLPTYPLPEGVTSSAFLKELAENGLKEKAEKGLLCLENHTFEDYKFRMIYELMMIEKMGYCDYYLIVWDFVNHAKNMGIPVGPGRGSGAGSLVAYLVGITEIDSIRYDLLFERFLNPERVSMPDFDVDFCYDRRDEVIAYVSEKYGKDHVSQIAAFGTLGARAAVRDVGRVLGISYGETDAVAKLIPHKPDMTIGEALKGKQLAELYRERLSVRQLLDTALAVEGMPRHITTHAAGVVITERPVSDYLPLATSSGAVLTQYDMNTVAELGLLKFDFLALRYLTVIENACCMVRRKEPEFSVEKIPPDDEKAMNLVCEGETEGLFQLESAGMKRLLVQMKPQNIEDLMMAIALYRPGPMESIPILLAARNSGKAPEYKIDRLKEILDSTSGVIVYQEQVMQIFRKIAGYSFGRADVVRRAMAKKHSEELERERTGFIEGAKKNFVKEEDANELFDSMVSFASYAFNKSHAAAYAVLAYRTVYLKAYYPEEYMAALLTSVCGDEKKTAEYISYLEKKKIPILPPDINESEKGFTATEKGVCFGLLGIKNVGEGFVQAVLDVRKKEGPFSSLEDFVRRMFRKGLNKSQLSALIGAGAFDSLGVFRSRMTEGMEELLSYVAEEQRRSTEGQIDLFSAAGGASSEEQAKAAFVYPDIPEYSLKQRLKTEKELTGMWLSGHPLFDYSRNMDALKPDGIAEILASFEDEGDPARRYRDGDAVAVCGMISSFSVKTSKAGNRFCLLRLEDAHGSMDALIFEKVLDRISDYLENGRPVYLKGKLSAKEEEEPKITVSDLMPLLPDSQFEHLSKELEPQSPKPAGKTAAEPGDKGEDRSLLADERAKSRAEVPTKAPGQSTAPKPKKLYIRLSDDEKINKRLTALLEIFAGTTPLVFYLPKEKRYVDSGQKVALSPYLLEVMREIGGEENIVYK